MFASSLIQKDSLGFESDRRLSAGYTEIIRGWVVIYYPKSEHVSSRCSRASRATNNSSKCLSLDVPNGMISGWFSNPSI